MKLANDITRCTRLFLHRGAIMKQQDQQKRQIKQKQNKKFRTSIKHTEISR